MWLAKRYFDVVSSEGAFVIGYDAVAALGPIPLRYRALLSSDPALRRTQYAVGRPAPDFPANLTFGGEVQWGLTAPSMPALSAVSGPMEWRLEGIGFPVRVGSAARTVSGRGYVETVRLSAPPWRLGVRSIRWGRFAGERSWACWNIVDGDWPIRLLVIDGEPREPEQVSENRLGAGRAQIELGEAVTPVQDGDVTQSELRAVTPLIRILAGRRFGVHQRKLVRRARLTTHTGFREEGLAMDELVRMS